MALQDHALRLAEVGQKMDQSLRERKTGKTSRHGNDDPVQVRQRRRHGKSTRPEAARGRPGLMSQDGSICGKRATEFLNNQNGSMLELEAEL